VVPLAPARNHLRPAGLRHGIHQQSLPAGSEASKGTRAHRKTYLHIYFSLRGVRLAFPLDLGEQGILRVSVHQPGVEHLLAARIAALCQASEATKPAVLCIGTDRSTGDALGPLVGTLLEEHHVGVEVWGTLPHPVHAANLPQVAEKLRELQLRPVIAVDACLGVQEQVGSIVVGKGCIRPGAGVNKVLPEVGDIHMTGTVNVAGHMEYLVLQNTRLWLVFKMALVMASALALVFPRGTPQRAASPLASLLPAPAAASYPQQR